jgi:hypothetical protein
MALRRRVGSRYIFEDVPMSLVPVASIGKRYGLRLRHGKHDPDCQLHPSHDYWRRSHVKQLEQWDVSGWRVLLDGRLTSMIFSA